MVEWGAKPPRLHGIDLLEGRIEAAKSLAPHIDYRRASAWPVPFTDTSMDIITANKVFSSILDAGARKALADEMVRVLSPDGVIMVYDFRYDNPRNRDVLSIDRREIRRFVPGMELAARTLTLAPLPARRITPVGPVLGLMLERGFLLRRTFQVIAHPFQPAPVDRQPYFAASRSEILYGVRSPPWLLRHSPQKFKKLRRCAARSFRTPLML